MYFREPRVSWSIERYTSGKEMELVNQISGKHARVLNQINVQVAENKHLPTSNLPLLCELCCLEQNSRPKYCDVCVVVDDDDDDDDACIWITFTFSDFTNESRMTEWKRTNERKVTQMTDFVPTTTWTNQSNDIDCMRMWAANSVFINQSHTCVCTFDFATDHFVSLSGGLDAEIDTKIEAKCQIHSCHSILPPKLFDRKQNFIDSKTVGRKNGAKISDAKLVDSSLTHSTRKVESSEQRRKSKCQCNNSSIPKYTNICTSSQQKKKTKTLTHTHTAITTDTHTTCMYMHTHTHVAEPSKTVFIKTQRTVEEYRCVENKTQQIRKVSFLFYFFH